MSTCTNKRKYDDDDSFLLYFSQREK